MNNNYINELKNILNFGIREDENLSREERIVRVKKFREELNYEKYSSLFNEIEAYLLNEDIALNNKEQVVLLLLECIRNFMIFEDNIQSFPDLIIMLYQSQLSLNRLSILFEQVYYSDITMPREYERIVLEYFDYLDNPSNECYIHYCYSRIENFNNKLIEYLNKTDYDGKKHKKNINNPELLSLLTERIDNLKNITI